MKEIEAYLEKSIEDEYFSKSEKKDLKAILKEKNVDEHQLAVIRSKIFDLAQSRINEKNYEFIIQWIENANKALVLQNQNNTLSEAYFSPGDTCRNVIINTIKQSVNNLKICVFTISDDLIANEILTSHEKGVEIQIITDNDKLDDLGSDIRKIASKKVKVKIDETPNHMHHKFMVADNKALLTGSYNWTRSAARYNQENILISKEPGLVKSYLKEFEQLWKEMVWF